MSTPNITPSDLIAFEQKVCESFKNKEILAPVHLYSGNEEKMISIFNQIKSEDWVFCSWRSHYQCLLKGVPSDVLLKDIQEGRSIALNYPEYRIFSSAIVTGIIPIATGVALSIKRQHLQNRVFCFLGDMTAETGCFLENYKYSQAYQLPITWIIEDNEKSVCTDTKKTWNITRSSWEFPTQPNVIYYKYTSKFPHAGTGERITF